MTNREFLFSLCTFAVIFLTSTSSAFAANWYIDNAAVGSNSGTSWANAWNSLTSATFGSLTAGDTLYISGGSSSKTYTGTLTVAPGTANGITITKGVDSGHNGEVIIDGAGVTANGIYVNATVSPLTNLTISNITFKRHTNAGIYGYGQHTGGLQYFTVDSCKFTDFRRSGVMVSGLNNLVNNHNIVVRNSNFNDDNTFTDQSDGIYAQVLTNFTADNNYIVLDNNYIDLVDGDLHSDNIQTYLVDNVVYSNNIAIKTTADQTLGTQMLFTEDGFGTHTFVNNVLVRNAPFAGGSAIRIKGVNQTGFVYGNSYYGYGPVLNSSPVATIRNNIFYGLGQPVTSTNFVRSLAGSTISNNIFYDPNNQFPTPTGGIETNPLFIDINLASANLYLQRTSPAIGAGAYLGVSYDNDLDGTTRDSNWDIGAYEYIPLGVVISKAGGQLDVTNLATINFTAVFSSSVSNFTTGDVTLTGTAGATTATVSGSGTTYNIAITGMTGSGTVIASILVDQATGATGNTNENSTSADNTVDYDIALPTGGSISYTDGYSTSVNLTVDDGTDAESGINTASRIVQRDSATMTGGICGTYGGFATITPTGTYPNFTDSTIISGNCYQYRYLVSDNATNQETYTSSNIVKVDTGFPSIPGIPSTTSPTNSLSQIWNWTASIDTAGGIDHYVFEWCLDSGFNGCVGNVAVKASNTHTSGLTNGTWYVRVKAVDGVGNDSGYSSNGTVVIDTIVPTIKITNIGLISNVPDQTNLMYYFTSQSPYIQGVTEANSVVHFEYNGHDYTATAAADGKYAISIFNPVLPRTTVKLTYYSIDLTGNKSAERTLTLVIGVENFPPGVIESPIDVPTTPTTPTIPVTPEPVEEIPNPVEPSFMTFKIVDEDGNLLVDATITIDGQKYVSDSKGQIYLKDMPSSNAKITVTYDGQTSTANVVNNRIITEVNENKSSEKDNTLNIMWIILLVTMMVVLLVVGGYLYWKKTQEDRNQAL